MLRFFFICLSAALSLQVKAQNPKNTQSRQSAQNPQSDLMSLPPLTPAHKVLNSRKIPPVGELIEAAIANSPMRHYQKERQREAELKVRSARREILENIGVEAYYRYGRLGVIDYTDSGAPLPEPVTTNNTQDQNWWYVGAYLRLPILDVVDRGNVIKTQKSIAKQSEYLMADAAQQISLKVVEEYNTLVLNLDLLAIKSTLLQTNDAQIRESEMQYRDGKITLGRLAQLQEMHAKVTTEYATALSGAREALLKLEALTGLALRELEDALGTQ